MNIIKQKVRAFYSWSLGMNPAKENEVEIFCIWHSVASCFFFFFVIVEDFYESEELEAYLKTKREFPDSPVVRTWHFHCWGLGSIPGWATKIPQVAWHSLNK